MKQTDYLLSLVWGVCFYSYLFYFNAFVLLVGVVFFILADMIESRIGSSYEELKFCYLEVSLWVNGVSTNEILLGTEEVLLRKLNGESEEMSLIRLVCSSICYREC